MVGREYRQLGDGTRFIEADIDRKLVVGLFAGADEVGVGGLAREIDAEQIGRVVPVEVASALDLSQGTLEKTLPLAADHLLGATTPEVTVDESQFLKNLVDATFSLR